MNKKLHIRFISIILAILLLIPSLNVSASDPELPDQPSADIPTAAEPVFEGDAKSLILIEASTGMVLYENNADEALPPASVTKIMTLLLVMEAVDRGEIKLTDPVTVSEAAASMGGSQVYLEVGEQLTVEEMIKCVVIASANDAALALAELVAGSEEAFVAEMNARAQALGMENTHFENTNGLDDTTENHVISARDIAIMSAELMKHTTILKYTTVWQDSIRNGAFVLTNTNRLIRFYPGANGLKTGSTSKAGFCISAAAKRDGMQLIAVVMGSSTRDSRNETAKQMLNWGFANYARITVSNQEELRIPVSGGKQTTVSADYDSFDLIVSKKNAKKLETDVQLNESAEAPVCVGDPVGKMVCMIDGEMVKEVPIYATEAVEKNTFGSLFLRILKKYLQI
ncbi:MAG: D-alanyl-D-alanine carboxypeptidase [Clostridia bacterium]|nr:D-alanyl-D-alanine carboxypeptidase [Clostridia bacterium]